MKVEIDKFSWYEKNRLRATLNPRKPLKGQGPDEVEWKHFDEKDRNYKGLNKNLNYFFHLCDEYLMNEML
jgi:hypothetical protein